MRLSQSKHKQTQSCTCGAKATISLSLSLSLFSSCPVLFCSFGLCVLIFFFAHTHTGKPAKGGNSIFLRFATVEDKKPLIPKRSAYYEQTLGQRGKEGGRRSSRRNEAKPKGNTPHTLLWHPVCLSVCCKE